MQQRVVAPHTNRLPQDIFETVKDAGVTTRQFAAFCLSAICGWTHREVGSALRADRSTVSHMVKEVRMKLTEPLSPYLDMNYVWEQPDEEDDFE